jgi:hypothetical protein
MNLHILSLIVWFLSPTQAGVPLCGLIIHHFFSLSLTSLTHSFLHFFPLSCFSLQQHEGSVAAYLYHDLFLFVTFAHAWFW